MDNINEQHIINLKGKNENQTSYYMEHEESEEDNEEIEDVEENLSYENPESGIEVLEENKVKIKSNLEFLLSQNDILPLLRKINKDKNRTQGELSFEKLIKKKSFETSAINQKNARLQNKIIENEQFSESEDDYEYVKLEEQPINLKNGELKEYQMEALNWLIKLHYMNVNGILADEMGLGKTIQTISLIAYLTLEKKNLFFIIIVPKVTINNWMREIKKWLPDLKVLYFYGSKEERKKLIDHDLKKKEFEVILTTFEMAIKEKTNLTKINYEYLIIDEAHRIKNEKAKLSTVVRQYKTNHRLLLTGTPLQNNLHELWSLLNFLMPNIFNDAIEFDKIFDLNTADEENQQKIVKQIHKLLRPFVLRRLKSEIEFKLPPKKEIYLYVGLSELQKGMYKQILSKNIDAVNGVNKDKIQLLNILIQLKKVCNHPYLFPKIEKGPPYEEGEHLVENSMKLRILDILLKKLFNEGSRVLIFSQMTTLLNILDDYCRYRGFRYCRIDGSTSSEDRDYRIQDFQHPDSDKFIFLLSTRAGGLGINLHSANIVIIYDSDWNPQVDLQAIDRAHRIGQTKPVTIYRFVTEGTVEEKIVERAAKKLKIDHLIIQKGKHTQNKVTALEMNNIIQYGADRIFTDDEINTNQKNIEEILEYSINKTEKIQDHLKDIEKKLNINNLSLVSDNSDIYKFEGQDYKKNFFGEESLNAQILTNLSFCFGQRERKLINSDLVDKSKKLDYKKPKQLTGWKAKAGGGYLHQFYNQEALNKLDEKENTWKEFLKKKEENPTFKYAIPEEFSEKDEILRNKLISEGWSNWTKKDFAKFLRACEIYGINDYENVSKFLKNKTQTEVEAYVKVFLSKINELPNGQRILSRINKFETEKTKFIEYQEILENVFSDINDQYDDIYSNLNIPYKIKVKITDNFTQEEDKYLLCLLFKYGYKNWSQIKSHIMIDPFMKFNFNMKLKTEQELADRSNFLINCYKLSKSKNIKSNGKKKEKNISKKKKKKIKKIKK